MACVLFVLVAESYKRWCFFVPALTTERQQSSKFFVKPLQGMELLLGSAGTVVVKM
jgi:hypothetical protein